MLAAALSACVHITQLMGNIENKREVENYTLAQTQEYIQTNPEFNSEAKQSLSMIAIIMYALPKGSNYASLELQIYLHCGQRELHHEHQY